VKVEIIARKGVTLTGFIHGSLGTLALIRTPPPGNPEPARIATTEERLPLPQVLSSSSRASVLSMPSDVGDFNHRGPTQVASIPVSKPSKPQTKPSVLISTFDSGFIASNGSVGSLVGGGAAAFIDDHDNFVIQGDAHITRFKETVGFYGSGNLIQYFHIPGLPFTPFAGAGVPIFASTDDTHFGVQVIFGFDRFTAGRLVFGGQIRTSFVSMVR
jgi:hypothetical protein